MPMRAVLTCLGLFCGAPALAAAPQLKVGTAILAPADIADARAYPQVEGEIAMLVTLEPAAIERIASDAPINFFIDGQAVCTPGAPLMGGDGTILLPCFAARDVAQVAALAKALSGKDPLPESLDDEP